MKVTLAIVILSVVLVGVQSSWYGGPSLSYGSHAVHAAGPWGAGAWGGPWAGAWHGAPAAVDVSGAWGGYGGHAGSWAGGYSGAYSGGYPGVSLTQGAHHLGGGGGGAYDYGYGHGHGHGVYVAKTRGAVHTAPLAGHVHSATALNVAAAPGTH